MRGQTSFTRPRALSQRVTWLFAASALTLTLALGGCRAGARNAGAQTIQQTQSGVSSSTSSSTGASTGSGNPSNSATLQQLQNIDNQNQSDAQQLNSAQSAAGVDYSSQENQTQP